MPRSKYSRDRRGTSQESDPARRPSDPASAAAADAARSSQPEPYRDRRETPQDGAAPAPAAPAEAEARAASSRGLGAPSRSSSPPPPPAGPPGPPRDPAEVEEVPRRDDSAPEILPNDTPTHVIIIVADQADLSEFDYVFNPRTSKHVRQRFVRNVYGILMIMLLVTFGFVALSVFVEPLNEFIRQNLFLYIVALIMFMVFYMTLVCCPKVRHTKPCNLIMLVFLTLTMSFMLACVAAYHSRIEVLLAVGGTCIICASLSLFAIVIPCDVTGWGLYLCLAMVALVVGALLCTIVCMGMGCPQYRVIGLVISCLFLLLVSMYLVYDTQLVVGGRRHQLPTNEYVLGVIIIYIDIALILMMLLHIVRY